MQAQRKFDDDIVASPASGHLGPRQVETDFAQWDDAIAASPARRLYRDLAAHFEGGPTPHVESHGDTTDSADKWPMPSRVIVILGSSIMLWLCIAGAAIAII